MERGREDKPQAQIRARTVPRGRGDCAHPRVPRLAGGRRGEPTAPPTPRPRLTQLGAVTTKCRAGQLFLNFPGRTRRSRAGLGLGTFPAELTPCSLTAPPGGGGGDRVLCVSGRVQSAHPSPSGVAGPQPHEVPSQPRPGPCIRVGAQSTLGPRVKVQRSHALGALPCPVLPSHGIQQALSALRCWKASPSRSVHPSSSSRTDAWLRCFSRGPAASPRDPGASPQICTASPPPATALPLRVRAPSRLCFLGSPGQGSWTLEPRALYLEVFSQKGFVSKIQFLLIDFLFHMSLILKSGAKLKFSYWRGFFFFPLLIFLSLGVFNFLCFDFEHALKLLCYL